MTVHILIFSVYDDVCSALEQWHSVEGQKIYIYSSGSVQAQKLLFGQSLVGDLLKYIDGHFDTAVGGKQEPASYTAIVEKIGCNTDDILFLTDVVKGKVYFYYLNLIILSSLLPQSAVTLSGPGCEKS